MAVILRELDRSDYGSRAVMFSVPKKARIDCDRIGEGQVASAASSAVAAGNTADTGGQRLRLLREVMQKRGVSAYLVETQDAHHSEYVADHDKRRAWLTGFTGSAGTAVVTSSKALMWTDGRYFLQVSRLRWASCKAERHSEREIIKKISVLTTAVLV